MARNTPQELTDIITNATIIDRARWPHPLTKGDLMARNKLPDGYEFSRTTDEFSRRVRRAACMVSVGQNLGVTYALSQDMREAREALAGAYRTVLECSIEDGRRIVNKTQKLTGLDRL